MPGDPEVTPIDLHVLADAAAAGRAAAAWIADAAARAVAARGRFVVALAGGSTPRTAYALLAGELRDRVPWERVHVCFGDERCVPPDDPASNYRMARETLLDRVPIPAPNVLRMPGELPPDDGAARAERDLRALLGDDPADALDVALLGVGGDGHTASLFPGGPALGERARWVVPAEAPPGVAPHWRLTLTLPVLCGAREVVVLAAGAEKRDAVRRAVAGETPPLPSALVRGREHTAWLVDAAAAP
jgi:6-phosphogluconolactonase